MNSCFKAYPRLLKYRYRLLIAGITSYGMQTWTGPVSEPLVRRPLGACHPSRIRTAETVRCQLGGEIVRYLLPFLGHHRQWGHHLMTSVECRHFSRFPWEYLYTRTHRGFSPTHRRSCHRASSARASVPATLRSCRSPYY